MYCVFLSYVTSHVDISRVIFIRQHVSYSSSPAPLLFCLPEARLLFTLVCLGLRFVCYSKAIHSLHFWQQLSACTDKLLFFCDCFVFVCLFKFGLPLYHTDPNMATVCVCFSVWCLLFFFLFHMTDQNMADQKFSKIHYSNKNKFGYYLRYKWLIWSAFSRPECLISVEILSSQDILWTQQKNLYNEDRGNAGVYNHVCCNFCNYSEALSQPWERLWVYREARFSTVNCGFVIL